MHIAVVTETFYPYISGTAKRYFEIFSRLAAKGHQVDIYTARLSDSWSEREEIKGLHIYRTKKVYNNFITQNSFRSVSSTIDFSYWVACRLLKAKYDIVEASHCPLVPIIVSAFCMLFKRKPLVATFHEVWYENWYLYAPKKMYVPLGIALEEITAKVPDYIISVSDFTAQRLVSCLGVPTKKIIVIPNGINLALCNKTRVERNEDKVVYAGRMNPHKKIEWLLECYLILKKVKPSTSLSLVGGGPALKKYVQLSQEYELDDVTFTGQVNDEDFISEIKSSRVYILPSIREGQSITVHEAMACGTPQVVVRSIDNAAAKIVEKSKSGLVVDPDPAQMAKAVFTLSTDQGLWVQLQKNGLEYAKDFSWDVIAGQYELALDIALYGQKNSIQHANTTIPQSLQVIPQKSKLSYA